MKGGIYKTKWGYQVRFGQITKRFKRHEYVLAERFLTGLRFKSDEGTFDIRDYRSDNPLGFENKVGEFLHSKRLLKGVKKYEQRLSFGINAWGNRNVKSIGFKEFDGLIGELRENGRSSKYIKDIRDCIKALYRWLWQTGEIAYDQIPRFPVVQAKMAYRKIFEHKETQTRVLDKVRKLSWGINPRIYIGILFLATYINVRPGELISIREKDIDLENGRILIHGRSTKTGEPKYIYLVENDVDLLRSHVGGFPLLPFFRHIKGRGGNPPNTQFGKGYLYNWWRKACLSLNISNVSLYPGTRHSSAVALRQTHSPEAIKRATMHKTNQAFDRYLQVEGDELRGLYADTRSDNAVITLSVSENGKKT